jgi:ubiquinol-cytochrome c reductase iron-sulfur subunit
VTEPDTRPEGLHIVAQRRPEPRRRWDAVTIVATLVAAVSAIVFAVTLLSAGPRDVYSLALGIGLLALAVAVRRFFAGTFPEVEAIEEREGPPADDAGPVGEVGATAPRRLPRRLLIGAAGVFGISLAAPVTALGPRVGEELRRTAWEAGRRVVTTGGEPVRPEDIAIGSALRVWPEGAIEDERSATILLRLTTRPQEPTNMDWVVEESLLGYSKICTHAGCPVGLFRERDNALFCPCHQTTFDAARAAIPTFGPAARALPQLPMTVDDDGYLVATGDYVEHVGPGYPWLPTRDEPEPEEA